MHIKHLFIALIISNVFTHTYSMHDIKQENTEYNLSQIQQWAPEDVWIHIIACSNAKGEIRETCSYFRELASTRNEKIFLQNPLVLVPKISDLFTLYYADFQNNDIVHNLLNQGANPNSVDGKGMTVMHYVARNGNLEIVKRLLTHPDYDATGMAKIQTSPLLLAAKSNKMKVVKYIISQCAIDYNAMLYVAIKHNLPNFIKLLLPHASQIDQVPDADFYYESNDKYFFSTSLLHYAAQYGHINLVQSLISQGTPGDLKDEKGHTPFHYAIVSDSTEMIKLLYNNNKDIVNSVDNTDLETPLHIAVKNGSTTKVLFLLNHGANIDAKDKEHRTALHLSANKGHFDIVWLLLLHNPKINERCIFINATALYYAYRCDRENIMKLLLQQPDIDLNIPEDQGSLLSCIIEKNHRFEDAEIIDLLIEKTDITKTNTYGKSPLSYALWQKDIPLISKLLKKSNIDINALYGQGLILTALDIALHITKRNPAMQEIVDLLKERGAKTKAQLEENGLLEKCNKTPSPNKLIYY